MILKETKGQPPVDVIVPVYNGEKYIPSLLETFSNQTFRDFHVIFVDDGSKDNSYQNLQEALKAVNFSAEVIHQENKGLPGARNTGIRMAKGKWLTFVDCDDQLDVHFLQYLYEAVEENQVPMGYCKLQMVAKEQVGLAQNTDQLSVQVISASECMRRYYQAWFGTPCMILQRQWLKDTGILFDEACTYLEDIPFITQVIAAAEKVAQIDNSLYFYLIHDGSLIHSPKIEKFQVGVDGFHRMAELLEKQTSDAARVFCQVGRARYYLATMRKGAVQFHYQAFLELSAIVPLEKYRSQISALTGSHKIAAYCYLFSKRLFYHGMRSLYKD